ncbi:MAG TPA: AI-2E family transporter [Burkholderiaceae bacterium]|jgi:predicted PurR-regulated permease PerM
MDARDAPDRPASPAFSLRAWPLTVLAVLAIIAALWLGRDFLIPLAMSATIATLLWPLLPILDRVLRLRALSALVAVLVTLFCVAALLMAMGTKLTSATDQFPSALRLMTRDVASLGTGSARAILRTRTALNELDRTVARATGTVAQPAVPSANLQADAQPAAPRSIVAKTLDGITQFAIEASKSAASVFLQVSMIALLTFFMLCSGELLAVRLRAWCHASLSRNLGGPQHCEPLLLMVARQVRLFAGVTVVTNLAIGVGVGLGFAFFDVPDPWTWGLVAAALHFLPYAGLVVMMCLAALEVYVAQSSMISALLGALLVMGIGTVVGTVMGMWLQGRVAKIDSATLFAGTIFWSVLWGGWGLALGPLMVVVAQLLLNESARLRVLAKPGDEAGPSTPASQGMEQATALPALPAMPAVQEV